MSMAIYIDHSTYWTNLMQDELDRLERLAEMDAGWARLSALISGKPQMIERVAAIVRAIPVWFCRRCAPRWRRGRWKAKS